MKTRLALVVILALLLAAMVRVERTRASVPVSPAPLLDLIADGEQEVGRLPARGLRVSDGEEIRIGNDMAAHLRFGANPANRTDDERLGMYLARVGGALAAHATRPLPYHFHYVSDPDMVNAFALPGGHVYVGAGILQWIDSEDELAALLGHEIEHIDHYHCADRAVTEARGRRFPLGEVAALPVALFQAGYSKQEELEADREGMRLAVAAGYSASGAVHLLETLDRRFHQEATPDASPGAELSRVAAASLSGYFRSHPPTAERLAQLRQLMATEHWNSFAERPLRESDVLATGRAESAWAAGHLSEAHRWAQRALELNASQWHARRLLAEVEFAQAQFAAAAADARRALQASPGDVALLERYADALAADHHPAAALAQFEDFLASRPAATTLDAAVLIEKAGLQRLDGDPTAFNGLASDRTGVHSAALSPELRGRWGWWQYRAGDWTWAASLLREAVAMRPQNARLQGELGWVLIAQHNYEEALARFAAARRDGDTLPFNLDRPPRNSPDEAAEDGQAAVGRCVALRLTSVPGAAPPDAGCDAALDQTPQWSNSEWVAAQYPPEVVRIASTLTRELRLRRLADQRLQDRREPPR